MKNAQNTTPRFDAFQIFDYKRNKTPVTHDIPPGYEKYIIPGSTTYSTTGRIGTFLFQEMAYPEYSFWISNYFAKVCEKVMGRLAEPSMELHFIVKGDVIYRIKGFDWQAIRGTQYNLLSIPQIENEVYFENRDYFTFDIHPSRKLLKKIAYQHPRLKDFLKKANDGHYTQFFEMPAFASPKVLFLIKKIMEYLKGKDSVFPSLNDMVKRLIELALTAPYKSNQVHFDYSDIESIYLAEKQMMKYMDDSKILEKQMDSVPMNKSKFRMGFQQIFGKRPNEYLRHKRMKKAHFLLEHYSHIRIKDIALAVGYANPNNFSTIYKHFFGISPLQSKH